MTLVAITLDASAAAAWLLPDAASQAADLLYAHAVTGSEAFQAPSLWAWEIGNLLHMAKRRGRLGAAQLSKALAMIWKAGVHLESAPDAQRMAATMTLAGRYALTYYDASYLEQAVRTGSRLASKDKALRAAAKSLGVACVDI